jgi:hypothetical protein
MSWGTGGDIPTDFSIISLRDLCANLRALSDGSGGDGGLSGTDTSSLLSLSRAHSDGVANAGQNSSVMALALTGDQAREANGSLSEAEINQYLRLAVALNKIYRSVAAGAHLWYPRVHLS